MACAWAHDPAPAGVEDEEEPPPPGTEDEVAETATAQLAAVAAYGGGEAYYDPLSGAPTAAGWHHGAEAGGVHGYYEAYHHAAGACSRGQLVVVRRVREFGLSGLVA